MSKTALTDITSEAQLAQALSGTTLESYQQALIDVLSSNTIEHGFYPKWREALDSLPEIKALSVGNEEDYWQIALPPLSDSQLLEIESALKALMPWRKGPYKLGPINLDTEWRSDWKWNRLAEYISPLSGREVLDVGCGNGYHMWRMHEAGARFVLGIEPSPLFNLQFQALQRYANISQIAMLPLTFEQFPQAKAFDTVFSMGVLYHRREPKEHLQALREALKPGGELVLETLIAPGEDDSEIDIVDRYACMRNVWNLPSVLRVARWMEEESFTDIHCVSVNVTSVFEQRSTPWMPFHSLHNALDPEDKSLTVEALPRPRRAILIASKPQ
jgi:tRNA (mo5U34)-methyltransferase